MNIRVRSETNLRALGLLLCTVTACAITAGCDKKETGATPAASASAPAAKAAACPAGQVAIAAPGICLAVPAGYVAPLNTDNSKDARSGGLQVSYSSDGTSGGKFVGVVQIYYGALPSTPPNFKALEDDAKEYCNPPPKLEDIDGGKGKFFQCISKKLEGHSYTKSKIFTAKSVIDCSSQSEKKPEIDTVCKTVKQL